LKERGVSRAYEIRWVVVSNSVKTDDSIRLDVSLLGILPEGEMTSLLEQELVRDGWTKQSDGSLTTDREDVHVVLSPDGKSVTLTTEASREVRARGTNPRNAEKQLDAASARAEAELKGEIAKTLSRVEPDVRAGLDAAVQRVYVEALRKKAASLGRVESVQETRGPDGEYEVTIRVKT
jgi:hypothetical protein